MIPDLTRCNKRETFVHTKQIKIRDLHIKTGEWVRRAARGEGIVITERGRPVASLVPFSEGRLGRSFKERHILPDFDALPDTSDDSHTF